MSAKANPLRVGIFAVSGAAILGAALFLFGIRSAFQPKYQMETYVVGDAEGLSKGSDVKLRGVVVGKVTEIGFSWKLYRDVPPRCVVVRFTIEQGVTPVGAGGDPEAELKRAVDDGLRAMVQAEGITGTSIVAIQTLDPKQYPPLDGAVEATELLHTLRSERLRPDSRIPQSDAVPPGDARRRENRGERESRSQLGGRSVP